MPKTIDRYCDIAGFDPTSDTSIFFAHDGSQGSLLRLHGLSTIRSRSEVGEALAVMAQRIGAPLKKAHHALTISYERHYNVEDNVRSHLARLKKASDAKMIGADRIVEEYGEIMRRDSAVETILLACWTRPGAAPSEEIAQDRREFRETWGALPLDEDVMNPMGRMPSLMGPHDSFVATIRDAIRTAGFKIELLRANENGRQDLAEIRKALLLHETPENWSPQHTGERRYPGVPKRRESSHKDLFAPTVAEQLMTSAAEVATDMRSIEMGGRKFAIAHLKMFPRQMPAFDRLSRALEAHDGQETEAIPYRIAWRIEGGGGGAMMAAREIGATFLAFLGTTNRMIKEACEGLRAVIGQDQETCVQCSLVAATWVEPHEEPSILSRRRSILSRSLGEWNQPTVSDSSHDPLRILSETVAGAVVNSKASTKSLPPITELSLSFPFHRAAPTFQVGESLFVTPDGKIAPHQAHSPDQAFWLTCISATPGSGKSMLMNRTNSDFAMFSPGSKLPFIGVIDIGISSAGLIDTLKHALPPEKAHLVGYVKLANERGRSDQRINPFDLGLGRRMPLGRETDFVVNFLTEILTLEDHNLERNLIGRIVRKLYQHHSDLEISTHLKIWQQGQEPVIDKACAEAGIELNARTPWWRIVDELSCNGQFEMAARAQRHAVPILEDVVRELASDELRKDFGEEIIRRAIASVTEAIDQFPLFSEATTLDLGDARIASIDLQDVAQRTGAEASPSAMRQNALMYMIASQLFMRKISGNAEEIEAMRIPEAMVETYRRYWSRVYDDIAETKKRFCMDEYHVTGGTPSIASQVQSYAREGRKWGLEVILTSQRLTDFPVFLEMASTVIILNADSRKDREHAQEVFGFSDAVADELLQHVHGPQGKRGASMLVRYKLKEREVWVRLWNRLSPRLLWALTTEKDDRLLRSALYERLPFDAAIDILVARFPDGTAQRLRETFADRRNDDEEAMASLMADFLVREASAQPTRVLA